MHVKTRETLAIIHAMCATSFLCRYHKVAFSLPLGGPQQALLPFIVTISINITQPLLPENRLDVHKIALAARTHTHYHKEAVH